LRWVEYGHADSKYEQNGKKRDEAGGAKASKSDGGAIIVQPKLYTHPTELSLDPSYQVHFELKTMDGETVSEAKSEPTNNELSADDPTTFKWVDMKSLAVNSINNDILLIFTVMTDSGEAIASGRLNLEEFKLFTQPNDKG